MINSKHPAKCPALGLRNRKSKLISSRYGSSLAPHAKVQRKSTSKKGVAGIAVLKQLAAQSRITAQLCGFFVRASFFGGLNGEPYGSPVNGLRQLPGTATRSSRHPQLQLGVTVVQRSNWRPIMVNITTPIVGQPLDAIARHQHISNAISTAQWHLSHGRINEATGRIMTAARHLKQLCTESTTTGVTT